MKMNYSKKRKGAYLPIILVLSVLFLALTTAIISLAMINIKLANNHRDKVLAMQIAEAGVNYYIWHLSHFPDKYCDGPENSALYCKHYDMNGDLVNDPTLDNKEWGYYTHDYVVDDRVIGSYKIKIYPPTTTRNVILIESVGQVTGRRIERALIAELGIPSYSRYTVFSNNAELFVRPGNEIGGTAFANHSGIFNDSKIGRLASSTELTYISEKTGPNTPGIAGDLGSYLGGTVFPVSPVNYLKVTDMQLMTFAGDTVYPERGGYYMVLHENNYDLFDVTNVVGFPDREKDIRKNDLDIVYDASSIRTMEYPESGLIYFKDDVWIDGDIGSNKVTIMAASFQDKNSKPKNIIINGNLMTDRDSGRIGLVSQQHIIVKKNIGQTLRIDANMIAQTGKIYRKQYYEADDPDRLEIYGSMAHNAGLQWSYYTSMSENHIVDGFLDVDILFDDASALSPPPKFPLTGNYQIQSIREKTGMTYIPS